jgi:hypothetical protein
MTTDQAKKVNFLISNEAWVEAANYILSLLGKPEISNRAQAVKVCQNLFQYLLDNEMYLQAATLQWGPHMFNTEPESTRRAFDAMDDSSRILLMGASSMSKSYGVGGWMLLDYLRDPLYTTVKLAAVNEDHLKKNLFAHVVTLYRACSIPSQYDITIQDAALWMGIKEAGNEFGISGIAFKQSQTTSGQFKGYKAKPVRKKPHPKFGYMGRLRVMGDECVRGDQRISMSDGSLIEIRDIVENKISGSVLSFNLSTKTVESKRIVGWHKVPLRGRLIVDVLGAKVTEDHPVLSSNGNYVVASDATTCLKIGHEELSSIRETKPIPDIAFNRRVAWRFLNLPERGSKREFSCEIHPRGSSIGLPEVEAGVNEEFYGSSNPGSVPDGIRRGDIRILDTVPSLLHGNPAPNVRKWTKEVYACDNSSNNPDGACRVDNGRRKHLQEQRGENVDGDNIHLRSTERGRGPCGIISEFIGHNVQGIPLQGEVDRENVSSGNGFDDCDNVSLFPSRNGIQIDGRNSASKATDPAKNDGADNFTLQDLRDSICEAKESRDLLPDLQPGAIEDTGLKGIQESTEDSFVFCIDVEDNHNFFAEGVCLHNCQNWPGGPFKDFNSLIASIDGLDLVKVACAFNPEDVSQEVVRMAEPEHGWNVDELDELYDYTSKAGWRVCRLDAAKCENVIQKKLIFPGLQTYDGFLSYLKAGGDNSPNYFTFARGFPPMVGTVNTIIPPSWPQSQRGEATFIETPENYAGVDLAFMGKDSAQMAVGRFGLASGWRDHYGTFQPFKDRLDVAKNKPRHVLQIDSIMPLSKHDDTVKMAEEIMAKCKMLGIKPENTSLDKTGYGFGTWSHLNKVWGDVFGIAWNEKATTRKILSEDLEGADKQCDGVMSEMWWAFKRWLDPRCCAILINTIIPPQPIHTQLTSRRYKHGKNGIKVEAKEEYMARNAGVSPDEADSLVMLVHIVRKKSEVIPGLHEEKLSGTRSKDGSGLVFTSVMKMAKTEVDDSISLSGIDEY